jgi:hypothetical protein
MILGAFGDSFLFGSDLSDIQDRDSVYWFYPSKLTFTALLAEKLNLQYYCTALPAQGNKVIADDVIRTVAQRGNDVFYFINWTWIDRFEYLGESRVGNASGWNSTLPGKNNKESNFYYKNFYSDLDAKLSNLLYINTVLDILLKEKCLFIMTYMDGLLFDKQWHCPVSIDYLQDKIKPYMHNFNGMNFFDWSKQNNFDISNHWHPLEDAHQTAANYWLPKVRTLLNSNATEEKPNASK